MYKKSKEIALLFAGALIGLIFIPAESWISKNLSLVIIISLVFIFYGAGILDGALNLWFLIHKRKNKTLKKVCIYAPYDIDKDTSSWINVSLSQIKRKLDSEKIKYRISQKESDFQKFLIIINPYGGAYPENSISDLKSLDRIFSFVRNGGIYINIADIPFYYAYEKNLKRRIDTTPLVGNYSVNRSFLDTILSKKLHSFVFPIHDGVDFENGIKRVIQLSSSAHNFFDREFLKKIEHLEIKCSPVLAIPFGNGYFVFSTIEIDEKNLNSISDLIKKSLDLMV